MARRRNLGGDCINRLVYSILAAWCLAVANAELYIVMFKESAQAQQLVAADSWDVGALHDTMLSSALGGETRIQKAHDYTTCFSGVSVDLTEQQAAALSRNDNVLLVEKDQMMYISTTHTPDYMALPTGAWNRTGGVSNAGEGIVIGVVDTGIYPDHPSFANDSANPYPPHPTFKGACGVDGRVPAGFCNGKIVGARQFFQASIMSGAANLSDPDVNSPLDGNGHGSHCAGTAAGNYGVPVIVHGQDFGNASGVAPRARIAVYKALDEKGQGRTSDILAAIDQGVQDRVNIISLSLGPSSAPVGNVTFTDSIALACLGATKAGVSCVHAAGNTGPDASSVTSWSPWFTSVGATTTDRVYPSYLFTGDGRNYSGQGLSPSTLGETSYRMIRGNDAVVATDQLNRDFDCADSSILDRSLIEGKILICSWSGVPNFTGSLSNYSRVAAQTMGAVGLVLLLNQDYFETNSPSSWNFQGFPAIAITGRASYQALRTYYLAASQNAAGATGKLSGGNKAVYTGQPAKIAVFSSRGPNFYFGLDMPSQTNQPVADVLKPNVVAPGVDIWSAWTPLPTSDKASFRGQKWSMISGTSMAAPHVAGAAAIVKQMHPEWSPSAIASALSTTAIPLDTLNNTLVAYDYEYDPFGSVAQLIKRPGNAFDFGNGFVDATSALNPGLIFNASYADYIKFLCAERLLSAAGVYAATSEMCPPEPGLSSDLNLPSITIGNLTTSRVVPRVVTNVGLNETYTAVITKPADVEVVVVPSTFIVAPGATQLLTVTLTALSNSIYVNQTSFGRIYLIGNLGHRVQVPVTVSYKQV